MSENRVLVTGGAGFIGSHTADALAKKGYAVRILDNLQMEVHRGKWPDYDTAKAYELIRGDVRNKSGLDSGRSRRRLRLPPGRLPGSALRLQQLFL